MNYETVVDSQISGTHLSDGSAIIRFDETGQNFIILGHEIPALMEFLSRVDLENSKIYGRK